MSLKAAELYRQSANETRWKSYIHGFMLAASRPVTRDAMALLLKWRETDKSKQ